MRHFIAIGLCLCAAGSAAAQTEVIIRRPGEKDQVIHLDSTHTKEALAKAQVELRKATTSIQHRFQAMEQQFTDERMNQMPVRINTLALKNSELAARNLIAPMIAQLQELRRQPHLGIVVETRMRDTDRWGAYVASVTPGSPADKAGILSGDIIMRIAGKSLTEKPAKGDGRDESSPGLRLISIVSQLEAGKAVDVELRRDNQNRTVKITPVEDEMPSVARMMPDRIPWAGGFAYAMPGREFTGRLPTPELMNQFESPSMSLFSNGMPGTFSYSFSSNGLFGNLELVSLNEKLGSYFGTSEGVLVVNTMTERPSALRVYRADSNRVTLRGGTGGAGGRRIEADSNAAPAKGPAKAFNMNAIGLEPGDVIVSVDGRKVTTPSQLMRIVGSYDRGDDFKLQIMRQKRAETLTVKMP